MDSVQFIVKLINQISAPSKAAIADLKALEKQALATQKAIAGIGKAAPRIPSLPKIPGVSGGAGRGGAGAGLPGFDWLGEMKSFQRDAAYRARLQMKAAEDAARAARATKPAAAAAGFDWSGEVGGFHKDAVGRAKVNMKGIADAEKAAAAAQKAAAREAAAAQKAAAKEAALALKNNQANVQAWSQTSLGAFGRFKAGMSGMWTSLKEATKHGASPEAKMAGMAGMLESFSTLKSSFGQLATLGGPVIGVITGIGGALMSLAKYAALAGAALGAVVVGVSAWFAKTIIETSNMRQNMTIAFQALLGNGEGVFARVQQAAVDLGMGVGAAAEQLRGLAAAGFKGEEGFHWLYRLQDLSAIGIQPETIGRIQLAMSQIRGAGVLQGDELRQLQETGLDIGLIWSEIAKSIGKTVPEAKKLKEQGKITADIAVSAIDKAIAALTKAPEAGAARRAHVDQTVLGQWQQLKAVAENFWIDVSQKGAKAFDSLIPVIKSISAWFKSQDAGQWAERAGKYFSFLIDAAEKVFGVIKAFTTGLVPELGASFDRLAKGQNPFDRLSDPDVLKKVEEVGASVGRIVGWVIEAVPQVISLGTTISTWMENNRAVIETVKLALVMVGVVLGSIAVSAAAIGWVLAQPFILMSLAIQGAIDLTNTLISVLNAIPFVDINIPKIGGAGGAQPGSEVWGARGAEGAKSALDIIETHAAGGPVGAGGGVAGEGEYVVPKGGALVLSGGGGGGGGRPNINVYIQGGDPGAVWSQLEPKLNAWWLGIADAEGA